MSTFDQIRAALAGTIAELHDARRAATQELISFKAGEKLMAKRAEELEAAVANWQQRAEQALLAGDEDLAKEALVRRDETRAELARVRAERDAAAQVAAAMLRGRREVDAKLAQLEARQGAIAVKLAGDTAFTASGDAWDRMDEAERRIEEDAIVAELSEDEIDPAARASHELDRLEKEGRADDELAALKRKLKEE
jgi:phage shock protein A